MLGQDRKKKKISLHCIETGNTGGGHQCQVACKVDLRLSLRAFPLQLVDRQRNVNACICL